MAENKFVNKPVCFNLSDPDQEKMFNHATKRPNFSSYIKRLIQRDIEGVSYTRPSNQIVEEGLMDFNIDLMKNLI